MYSSSQDYLPKFPFNNAETHSDLRDTLRKQAGFEQEQLRKQSVYAKRLADEIEIGNCMNYIFEVLTLKLKYFDSVQKSQSLDSGWVGVVCQVARILSAKATECS